MKKRAQVKIFSFFRKKIEPPAAPPEPDEYQPGPRQVVPEESKYLKAYIDRPSGAPIGPLSLPKSLKSVKLERFVNFVVSCRAFDIEGKNPILVMADAVSEFLDYPLIEIVQGQVGDVYAPENSGLDSSIAGIFAYISKLCYSAQGRIIDADNATFEVDGVLYEIPRITQQAIAGEVELPYLSVIQVIECVEFQRLKDMEVQITGDPGGFVSRSILDAAKIETDNLPEDDPARMYILQAAEKVKTKEIEKLGDPNGSQMYNLYLRLAAIISRRYDGENPMPIEDAAREVWINQRIMALRNMDVQTALDIDFFLSSILSGLEHTPAIVGSLTRPLTAQAAEMLLKAQRGPKRKRTTKKSSSA